MEFETFAENVQKVHSLIEVKLHAYENRELVEIYAALSDFLEEITIIVQRIETETQEIVSTNHKILQLWREKKKVPDELGKKGMEQLILIRLDVKCFFILSRIFLDTLARVIRYFFGSKGRELPHSMRKLIKNKKFTTLTPEFAKGLKTKMSCFDDLVEKRDEITRHLGNMVSTTTIDGKFGFDILGLNSPKTWGTTTVKPILDYINDSLTKLSEVIIFIYNIFEE